MQISFILCKMEKKFKSSEEIHAIADAIKSSRKNSGLTLEELERKLKINRGQLSRFETGDFKTRSKNLQKICKFFDLEKTMDVTETSTLGARIERFAKQSVKHKEAAEKLIQALEQLL